MQKHAHTALPPTLLLQALMTAVTVSHVVRCQVKSEVQVLERCIETAELLGVIHLALCSHQQGLVMRWKTRLKAYIDPG